MSKFVMVTLRFTMVLAVLSMAIFSSLQTHAESGGISLAQTRVIFSADHPSEIVTVINSSSQSYLVQSRVQTEANGVTTAPFIVTPPLFSLPGNSRQLLRVLPQEAVLPVDRESLFYLVVSAIPAQDGPVPEQNKLSVGLRFVLKLFYRPTGLAISPEQASCKLTFSPHAQGTLVMNTTPYYLTLGKLSSDGRELNLDRKQSMIAPKSQQIVPIKLGHNVNWQTINDYGGLSTVCHQSLMVKGTS